MGYSYRQQMPVADLIFDRLPATLLLTGTAFFISLLLGVLLGALAAARAGRTAAARAADLGTTDKHSGGGEQ